MGQAVENTTSRRALLAGGGAVAATTWVAPSVLALDRVSAAVGSCGTPPVQVDWTAYANTFPTSVTANDGTVVNIAISDPFGVADAGFFGLVFNGTTSTLDNPLLMAMSNANNGDFTSLIFTFSQPVAPCFELLDVDRGTNSWEDTVLFNGTNGGVAVPLGPGDVVAGPANTVVGLNTVVGTGSAPNSTTDGNMTVTYPGPIDELEIRHADNTAWTGFQYIGIHDLRWC